MNIWVPPSLEPELQLPLERAVARLPSLTLDGIPLRRAHTDANLVNDATIGRGGAFEVEERAIPSSNNEIGTRLLICRPTASAGPHPVICNIHGGGMVAGSPRGADLLGDLNLAEAVQAAVIAIEYRLAPEYPDPIPVSDCYSAVKWIAEHNDELGVDPGRVVLSGNSAGGGLAAGVALLARDRRGPLLLGQMLQCPMLDDRCNSVSARQMEHVGLWDTASNRTGWSALLGNRRGTDEVSQYAAPARATDLSGLPATYLDVGSVESLRDEGIEFALRIWQAGGSAELHVWQGAFHSFDQWAPNAVISRAAEAIRIAWLRRLFAASEDAVLVR